MSKLKLIFGVHCHQPVGNFEHVFEEAYAQSYLPFLEAISKHPRVKFSAHYSGVLFDWFQHNRPEFIELLKKLVKREQLELLSGGYYEPILSLIPDDDKLAQIERSNQFIKQNFMTSPRGLWLTERVWEPSLPKILSKAGIEYVLVDDDHLVQAGFDQRKISGHYITDYEGDTVKLFPINRRLREIIPTSSPHDVVKHLKEFADERKDSQVIFMDDGEKFGLRNGTNPDYLHELLVALEENSDWLDFTTFSEQLDETLPTAQVYLPNSSYREMNEWSGGHFKNFLTKYPEANNMHKKMLAISGQIRVMASAKGLFGRHEKEKELAAARQYLYQAQGNNAFWHGLFGGIYLKHLREAVYANLIKAELELEKIRRGSKPFVELTVTDFDKDGHDEALLSNDLLTLYFSPERGGSLFELDYKPRQVNVLNTISRQKEAYHVSPSEHDRRPRLSMLDHFISLDNQAEIGDFVEGSYSFMPKRGGTEVGLRLTRDGRVGESPVKIEKTATLLTKQSIVTIDYEITNSGQEECRFYFGVEFNLSTIVDEPLAFEVLLDTDKAAETLRFPVETISRSEVGLEKIHQGTCVIPTWKFKLAASEMWRVRIILRIE
ncbi:MAG: alpha-amylase/4-alpha-glucanotransferase domain-containing protein [bacterium]